MNKKVFTGYRILDISSFKYYFKEFSIGIFALLLSGLIFSFGRNYVITHSPFYVFQENWQMAFPKSTEIIESYGDTDWLGEGKKFSVLKIDKADTTNTFFDLKYFYTGLTLEEHNTVLGLLKDMSKTELKKQLLGENVKFRKTRKRAKAWDGSLTDKCKLYVCFDECSGYYYLFEVFTKGI